jgi:hypothetical protein
MGTEVTLNRQIPRITITDPTTNVVATPYIQVQGCSALPLASVTFDVSNAVVVVTNREGFLTGHYFDPNTSSYTTDYFQCFDISLADGPNIITLHATDPAGNSTNIALNVTLDYSTATNPVIKLYWPQDNTAVIGNSFTLRGWTEDAVAQVTAQIVNTNGDTNVISGEVEREGTLWVENLPLSSGTNWLTLWVTNSAGYSSETNIVVVQSTLNLTIVPLSGDLWQPTTTVYGSISDPDDYTVWVNGVKATLSGNYWMAQNVPLPGGSTPTVQARAIPNSNNGGNGTGGNGGGPVSYDNLGNPDPAQDNDAESGTEGDVGVENDFVKWNDISSVWNLSIIDYLFEIDIQNLNWSATNGGSYNEIVAALWGSSTNFTHISASDSSWAYSHQEQGGLLSLGRYSFELKQSQAKMLLHTGGRSGVGRRGLFRLTATATEEVPVADSGGQYHQAGIVDGPGIPNDQIIVGGKQLDTNGVVWKVYPDGKTIDVTPQANAPLYSFTEPPPSKQCAPVEIDFLDQPRRPNNLVPGWSWEATLTAVADPGNGQPSIALASISYGFSFNANGNMTGNPPPSSWHSGICGAVVIDNFQYAVFTSEGRTGAKFEAHYIGCQDLGELKWIQTITSDNRPVDSTEAAQLPHYNDHLGSSGPFYYGPGDLPSYDYTDYADWLNGSCP